MSNNPKVSYEGPTRQPGIQARMKPEPRAARPNYQPSGKLEGLVSLITGGDSGIGRSAAVLFAKEGADVAIAYLDESEDAQATRQLIELEGRRCLLIPGDLGSLDLRWSTFGGHRRADVTPLSWPGRVRLRNARG